MKETSNPIRKQKTAETYNQLLLALYNNSISKITTDRADLPPPVSIRNLDFSLLTQDEWMELTEALADSKVSKICISERNLGKEGAKALAQIISSNPNLVEVAVYKCNIGAEGEKVINDAAASKPNLVLIPDHAQEYLITREEQVSSLGVASDHEVTL